LNIAPVLSGRPNNTSSPEHRQPPSSRVR
jgi:hypothetical protein